MSKMHLASVLIMIDYPRPIPNYLNNESGKNLMTKLHQDLKTISETKKAYFFEHFEYFKKGKVLISVHSGS